MPKLYKKDPWRCNLPRRRWTEGLDSCRLGCGHACWILPRVCKHVAEREGRLCGNGSMVARLFVDCVSVYDFLTPVLLVAGVVLVLVLVLMCRVWRGREIKMGYGGRWAAGWEGLPWSQG